MKKKKPVNKNEGTNNTLYEEDFETVDEPPKPKRNVKELFQKGVKKQITLNKEKRIKEFLNKAKPPQTPQPKCWRVI
jgi:hypothetical protein